MKKRLRKKRRLGEFTHYGYGFEGEWTEDLSGKDYDFDIIDGFWDLITEWGNKRGFVTGGGSNNLTFGFILDSWKSGSQKQHNSPTDKDRDELIELLKTNKNIKLIKATDRIDLWHGKEDQAENYTIEIKK